MIANSKPAGTGFFTEEEYVEMQSYIGERMRNEFGGLEDHEGRKRTEAVSLPEVCCAGRSLASGQLFISWISTTPTDTCHICTVNNCRLGI